MSDTKFAAVLFVAVLILMGLSGYVGLLRERRSWQTIIPDQMNELCMECAGLNK